MILLPKHIYILVRKNEDKLDCTEYNLYFRNFVYPMSVTDFVQVECEYGMNLGDCIRWKEFPIGLKEFPLYIAKRDAMGNLLEEASTTVVLVASERKAKCLILGDSMTKAGYYGHKTAQRLPELEFIGTRVCQDTHCEGRGGWTLQRYFEQFTPYIRGVSPFLFPNEISGEDYYGDFDYMQEGLLRPLNNEYTHVGFTYSDIREGQYYLKNGDLYRYYENAEDEFVQKSPVYSFDFAKYLAKNKLPCPDAVTLLFGANEFQKILLPDTPKEFLPTADGQTYYEFETRLNKTLSCYHQAIVAFRAVNPDIKIIINLPILGGNQYHWGERLGAHWSEKQYNLSILKFCHALLEQYDGKEEEGIFLSPMLLTMDTETAFPTEERQKNCYTEETKTVQVNWVHPKETGYYQMSDAMVGALTASLNLPS